MANVDDDERYHAIGDRTNEADSWHDRFISEQNNLIKMELAFLDLINAVMKHRIEKDEETDEDFELYATLDSLDQPK